MSQQDEVKRIHFGEWKVEQWYKTVIEEPLTFKTDFINMSMAQGEAILHYYEAHAKRIPDKKKFTEQDVALLEQLQAHMQTLINEKFGGKKIFVRMSTRSPKDGCLRMKIFKDKLAEELLKLEAEHEKNPSLVVNESFAVVKTLHHCQCVNDAKQALELLCTSERVFFLLSSCYFFSFCCFRRYLHGHDSCLFKSGFIAAKAFCRQGKHHFTRSNYYYS